MTEQEAKNELIRQAKNSLRNLRRFADDIEAAILSDNDVLIKIKSTQLIFLEHFTEHHLEDMAKQSFAAYRAAGLAKNIFAEILQ